MSREGRRARRERVWREREERSADSGDNGFVPCLLTGVQLVALICSVLLALLLLAWAVSR